MRYILFSLVITSLFVLACGQKEEVKMEHNQQANETAVQMAEEQLIYYTCPMEAHSHVRTDKAGTCADCGMELKPMRLKKS